ncbi:alkaline phosphatase family protein [Haladaptatus sp. DFWS20]|uniref:alkaline phosphatase family protein n=1 Tax=Haladaptatus sp. DFWS20 TaxID=3403467 RepID=UPI003EBED9A8
MLRHDVAKDLRDDELAPGYVRPAYDGYCFANVSGTVADLLGVGGVIVSPQLPDDTLPTTEISRVAVILVDGFGFEQFLRYREAHPFLETLAEEAIVTPLTSTYPSETAAAMTTYYLGQPPVQHGLLGWDVYRADIDTVVKPLPFVTAGGANPVDFDLSPRDLREGKSVGRRLSAAGADVHRVVPDMAWLG